MNTVNVSIIKEELQKQLYEQCINSRLETSAKEDFLNDLWHALSSFVHLNEQNPLLQSAVMSLENGDLIPRAFLVLSVQYGSYHSEPSLAKILKDFVDMLDKDLDEEELRICGYAEGKTRTFFPELHEVWKNIREVYGAEEFSLSVLPPTPYYAYVLLALNRHSDIVHKTRHAKLFGELSVSHYQMQQVGILAKAGIRPDF